MTKVEKDVKEIIEKIINDIGYELYDVIYEKEGKDNYLRIFIDKEDGIDLNDCEAVNNAINDILDEKDPIKSQYFLEVSSPGLERRIRDDKHLEANIDKEIEVHTFKKYEDKKELKGTLKSFDENQIELEIEEDNKIIKIDKKDIANMKTIFNWEEI
jgi:ribosome maturation factor RimP